MSTSQHPSIRRPERVAWLRNHPELSRLTRKEIICKMKESRLLSAKTYELDVNLYNLMRDAGWPRRACIKFSRAPHLHGAE